MVFMQSIDSAEEVKSYLQKKYSLTGLNCLSWKVKVSGFSFFEGFDSSGKVFVKWGGKSNNCPLYRIGGRQRSRDASFCGATVGIPPFGYWISNQPP